MNTNDELKMTWEGGSHILFQGSILAFSCRKVRETIKTWVRIGYVLAKIWSGHLLNTHVLCYSLYWLFSG